MEIPIPLEKQIRILKQLSDEAKSGVLGDKIQTIEDEYKSLHSDIAVSLKAVFDYYKCILSMSQPELIAISAFQHCLFRLIIFAYREAKRIDPVVALSIVKSSFEDYPGVPGSSLFPKYTTLNRTLIARIEVNEISELLAWSQATQQFLAYNEFLSGLLSYLIILLKTAKSERINLGVFSANYSNKIDQFRRLLGEENNEYDSIFWLMQPKVRNAIAHGTLFRDSDTNKVEYLNGRPPVKQEILYSKFISMCVIGSRLFLPYFAATHLITLMESYSDLAKDLLPQDSVELFNSLL